MTTYILILSNPDNLSDDEFEEEIKSRLRGCNICECNCKTCEEFPDFNFEIVEAHNLEGFTDYQYLCRKHNYEWNIKEDGTDEGCLKCKEENDR